MDTGAISAVVYAIRQAMKLNPEIFVSVATFTERALPRPHGRRAGRPLRNSRPKPDSVREPPPAETLRAGAADRCLQLHLRLLALDDKRISWWCATASASPPPGSQSPPWSGLAYAPQVLSFFELTPYFGNAFGILLTLWSMVAVIVAIVAGLELTLGQAVFASALGWALLQLVRRTIGIPVNNAWRWFRTPRHRQPPSLHAEDLPQLRRRAELVRSRQIATAFQSGREDRHRKIQADAEPKSVD